MRKSIVLGIFLALLVLATVSDGYAQFTQDQKVDLRARLPQQNGFTVAINRIQGSTWSSRAMVDFGDLVFDSTNNIFVSNYFYAVDVGISANLPNWSIKHNRTSLANATAGADLNNNLNVAFVKQLSSINDQPLEKVTYANSDNKIYTKNQLADGWLRIYYGLATGNTTTDAPGAQPIGVDKPAGIYTGQVTLTLFETM